MQRNSTSINPLSKRNAKRKLQNQRVQCQNKILQLTLNINLNLVCGNFVSRSQRKASTMPFSSQKTTTTWMRLPFGQTLKGLKICAGYVAFVRRRHIPNCIQQPSCESGVKKKSSKYHIFSTLYPTCQFPADYFYSDAIN